MNIIIAILQLLIIIGILVLVVFIIRDVNRIQQQRNIYIQNIIDKELGIENINNSQE